MRKLTPAPKAKGKIVDMNVNMNERTIEAMQVETVDEFDGRPRLVALLCNCLCWIGRGLKWWFS